MEVLDYENGNSLELMKSDFKHPASNEVRKHFLRIKLDQVKFNMWNRLAFESWWPYPLQEVRIRLDNFHLVNNYRYFMTSQG